MFAHPCLNTDNRYTRARGWGDCGLPTWDSMVPYSRHPCQVGLKMKV